LFWIGSQGAHQGAPDGFDFTRAARAILKKCRRASKAADSSLVIHG
jgi:hypothetical protein